MASSVPSPTLGTTGFTAPDEGTILDAVQNDINAAFGGALDPGLSTPQGQLASTLTALVGDKNNGFLGIVNQVDPQYSQGRMQDGIARIYFLTRFPATPTRVWCTCTGAAGTVIPAGTTSAQDTSGNLYSAVAGGVIGVSGNVSLQFQNIVTGPIACPAGTLTSTYLTIAGWDSITNPADGTLGTDVETPQAFEYRRSQSVSINSSGKISAIRAAVLASGASLIPPMRPSDVFCTDNPTSADEVIGGVTVPKNSLYVAVVGGDSTSIANAILAKKDVGCNYAPSAIFTASCATSVLSVSAVSSGILTVGQTVSGLGIPSGSYITSLGTGTGGTGTYNLSTTPGTVTSEAMTSAMTVVIYDTSYSTPPFPAYTVSYTKAVPVAINIQVTLAAASKPPSNALALLQAANGLVTAFTGADGGPALRIGGTIYSSRFYTTIAALLPGVSIVSVAVGTGSPSSNSQSLNIDQYPVIGTITLVLV